MLVTAVTAVVTACVRKKVNEINVVTAVTAVTAWIADGCGWGEVRRHRWSFSPKRKEKSYLSLGGGDSGDSLEKPSLLAVTTAVTSGDKAVTTSRGILRVVVFGVAQDGVLHHVEAGALGLSGQSILLGKTA